PFARDVARHRITGGQSSGDDEQGFLAAIAIRQPPTTGTRDEIQERMRGSDDAGPDRREFEGLREEERQDRYHRQLRTEVAEVKYVEDRHLLELVAMQLRHRRVQETTVGLPHLVKVEQQHEQHRNV